jgi:hypothetical protein
MANIPITALVETIEAMRSEASGRFTAGEVEIFGEVLIVLRSYEQLPMDRRKETVILLAVQALRLFLSPEIFQMIEHHLKF